jgi:SAM-dependent methyltransferase
VAEPTILTAMTVRLRDVRGEIRAGKSIARALMNQAVRGHILTGRVLDVGSHGVPTYIERMTHREPLELERVDLSFPDGSPGHVDLESQPIPHPDASFDQVLIFNLLEHLYESSNVLREARRVLRDGGQLVGFVPFLVQYHPDPHDYFRYTGEALARMLADAGFSGVQVEEIGRGPFAVNYMNLMFAAPMPIRVGLLYGYWALDSLFLSLRPEAAARYPLGYLFRASTRS